MSHRTEHYVGLDAIRGVAAIAVVCLHMVGNLRGAPQFLQASFAVDLFFILSGFVLERAYARRLSSGWPFKGFFLTRLIRMYPLYIAATAVGIAVYLGAVFLGRNPPPMWLLLVELPFAIFFLPSPGRWGMVDDKTFGLVSPAWSLFFELIVNGVYAVTFQWLGKRVLIAIIAASALGLILYNHLAGDLVAGNRWSNFAGGFPRVTFGFFAGVALYRVHISRKFGQLPSFAIVPLIVTLLALFEWAPAWRFWSSFAVIVLLPLVIMVGAHIKMHGTLQKGGLILGSASYAIYVLHYPFLSGVSQVARRFWNYDNTPLWTGPLFVVTVFIAALVADRLYDGPVRRALLRLQELRGLS